MSKANVWQMSEAEIYAVCQQCDDAPAALVPQCCATYLRNKWSREPDRAEVAALVTRVMGGSASTSVQG